MSEKSVPVDPGPLLFKGQQFDSWAEYLVAVQNFMDAGSHPFVKTSRKTAAQANRDLNNPPYFPDTEKLPFAYIR
jgi:hypothetical protein